MIRTVLCTLYCCHDGWNCIFDITLTIKYSRFIIPYPNPVYTCTGFRSGIMKLSRNVPKSITYTKKYPLYFCINLNMFAYSFVSEHSKHLFSFKKKCCINSSAARGAGGGGSTRVADASIENASFFYVLPYLHLGLSYMHSCSVKIS